MELEDVELIDVPDEAPVVPGELRKNTSNPSVQKDKGKEKSIRLPKRKPQFSYTSGKQPELPFLKGQKEIIKDQFDFDELSGDEFPTTTELAGNSQDASRSEDYENSSGTQKAKLQASTYDNDSLKDLEAGMVEFDEDFVAPAPTPTPRQSFAERLFDFDAFDDVIGRFGEEPSESKAAISSMVEQTRESESSATAEAEEQATRATSLEADIEEVKFRRVTQAEQVQESAAAGNLPEWVNEFDAELIDSLKDYVDFVDE